MDKLLQAGVVPFRQSDGRWEFQMLGNFLHAGWTPEFGSELLLCLGDVTGAFVHIFRNPDERRLFEHRAPYGLFNPPNGIGAKFQVASIIVTFSGSHQADVTFLNEIGQR